MGELSVCLGMLMEGCFVLYFRKLLNYYQTPFLSPTFDSIHMEVYGGLALTKVASLNVFVDVTICFTQ